MIEPQSVMKKRRGFVMDRFLWISHVQVLFSQLRKQETHEGLAYVDKENYLAALDKIQPCLPLIDFYEGGQKTLSFDHIYSSVEKINRPTISLD